MADPSAQERAYELSPCIDLYCGSPPTCDQCIQARAIAKAIREAERAAYRRALEAAAIAVAEHNYYDAKRPSDLNASRVWTRPLAKLIRALPDEATDA